MLQNTRIVVHCKLPYIQRKPWAKTKNMNKKKNHGGKKKQQKDPFMHLQQQKKIKENLTNKTFKLKHSLLGILLGTILWEATTLVLHKV